MRSQCPLGNSHSESAEYIPGVDDPGVDEKSSNKGDRTTIECQPNRAQRLRRWFGPLSGHKEFRGAAAKLIEIHGLRATEIDMALDPVYIAV